MTAQPKHWISSRRQGRRRATHTSVLAKTTKCKVCGSSKLPGFMCKNCKQ